jgi:hypothetical protein
MLETVEIQVRYFSTKFCLSLNAWYAHAKTLFKVHMSSHSREFSCKTSKLTHCELEQFALKSAHRATSIRVRKDLVPLQKNLTCMQL